MYISLLSFSLGDYDKILEQDTLTVDDIQKLFPHTTKYPIPKNQTNSKPYVIILYNPEGRDGAEDEARKLEQAWKTATHEVIMMPWTHTDQILRFLDDKLERLLGHCSLLTINIMCHGHRGVLCGSQNSSTTINNILYHLNSALAPFLPLVGILANLPTLIFSHSQYLK